MILLLAAIMFQSPATDAPFSSRSTVDQAKLDAMSDACRAPRIWLRSLGDDRVDFRPSPDAKYAKVVCVFKKMRRSNLPMNLGLVGNAAPELKN